MTDKYALAKRQLANAERNLIEAGTGGAIDVRLLAAADVIGSTRNVLVYGKAFIPQLKQAVRTLEKEALA